MTDETSDLLIEGWHARWEEGASVDEMEALAGRVGIADDPSVAGEIAWRRRPPPPPSPIMEAFRPAIAKEVQRYVDKHNALLRMLECGEEPATPTAYKISKPESDDAT